jgi:F-type H+-transporting ATPase subunit b
MTTTAFARLAAVTCILTLAVPGLAAAAEGAAKSVLEPDVVNSIVTLIVFLALLGVLYLTAWGPILKGLEAREAAQFQALEEARKAREEAAALRAQVQAELAKAAEQVRSILEEARRDAEALKAREREAGVKEAAAERERARREIEAARDAALKEIFEQAVRIATLMSEKTLARSITVEDHRRLFEESLAELNSVAGKA